MLGIPASVSVKNLTVRVTTLSEAYSDKYIAEAMPSGAPNNVHRLTRYMLPII